MTLCTRLETERLILRDMEVADAEIFAAFMATPLFYRYTSGVKTLESVTKQVETFIARNNAKPRIYYAWTILRKTGSQIIGEIRLGYDTNCKGEVRPGIALVAYGLDPELWGNGYTTEALKVVTAFAHDTLGLHRIEAETFDENSASWKVLENAGYQREGTKRYGFMAHGKYVPALHLYASVRPDKIPDNLKAKA
jgi:[ribosomal protein S5]-alanine N-acetyltransferase